MLIERVFYFSFFTFKNFRKVFEAVFFHGILPVLTFLSVESIERFIEFFARIFTHRRVDILGNVLEFHLAFGFADFLYDFFLESAETFDFLVSEKNSSHHFVI